LKIENFELLKKNLSFLSQLSKDQLYIRPNDGKIHFLNFNNERTIIGDYSFQWKKNPENFSIRLGNLFYDIFSRIEKGSDVFLDFNENKVICEVKYENIKFKSSLESYEDGFQGFPQYNPGDTFKISGKKLYHGLNLLARFKSDLKLTTDPDELVINAKNGDGDLELRIPSDIESKTDKVTTSTYDYEIIKHLLKPSKLAKKVEINLSFNKKLNDNLLILKFYYNGSNSTLKYLFTPKGELKWIILNLTRKTI